MGKDTSNNMKELIALAKAEGAYQPIEVKGKLLIDGYRECKDRWDIIKPHIKDHQTVMDLGSHYGYFSIQIAKKYPSTLVWSIEPNLMRVAIQISAIQLNKLNNIVLSMHEFTLVDLLKLQRTCESLDTILALSVIHYFPPDEIPEIIWTFSRLAQNLIIEFPSPEETDVANKDLVDNLNPEYLLGLMYDSVKLIGTSKAPKGNQQRSIYLAQNYNITRDRCMSYWDSLTGGKHKVTYNNLSWKIKGKFKKYNGLNLANLIRFNIHCPLIDDWLNEAAERYIRLIQTGPVTDIHPRNLIISHNGVFPIDYKENTDYGNPDYEKQLKKLTVVDIQQFLKDSLDNNLTAAMLNKQ